MSKSVFEAMKGGNAQPQMMNLQNALAQIRRDPVGVLRQAGLNIPANMNDPQSILSYLMQSGQVNGTQLARVRQMAGMFRR